MKFDKKLGFMLLGIWLIYVGLASIIDLSFIPGFIPAIVAIVAGVLIILKN